MGAFRKIILPILILFTILSSAKEGMWLPNLLEQINEKDMQSLGMKISADDIYSINHSSIKDAVVQFGGGCTGEIVSNEGLLITNHHCGFSQIQSISSLEVNFLKDGFWAKTREDEIPCPGLTATFIIEIRDVTENILPLLSDSLSEKERTNLVKQIADSLERSAVDGTHCKASTKSFFNGNKYYMFITEVFRDIRYVGAPPLDIAKFGGESDNWLWPREQADFSLWRIYAGSDNKPADYSKDNKPFRPRYFFPVNIGGVRSGDFTMVLGFPGKTNLYATSDALGMIYSQTNPDKVNIRDVKLKIWEQAMAQNDTVQLQYSSKYKTVVNYYKKWKYENEGIEKFDVISKRQKFEDEFISWTKSNPERTKEYGYVLEDYRSVLMRGKAYSFLNDYTSEALLGIELVNYVNTFRGLIEGNFRDSLGLQKVKALEEKLKKGISGSFKNYAPALDEKICAAMLELCWKNLPDTSRPAIFDKIKQDYSLDFKRYAHDVYSTSVFLQKNKLADVLENFDSSKAILLSKDPAWILSADVLSYQKVKVQPGYDLYMEESSAIQRKFMKGIMEMKKEEKLSPDANSTLRLSYGTVQGLTKSKKYKTYLTTLDEILKNEGKNATEYHVSDELKALISKKDFGRYAFHGTVPVNFLSSNHTTNGNSGSPVLNAKGELIGVNFDRASEGMVSDLMYDENSGRNISVDIRYVLFLIEKVGKLDRLISEMKIVND